MSEFKSYSCPVCGGGMVSMMSARGRPRHFRRGVTRPVPEGVLIPTCDACGEVFIGPEDAERIDDALRAALRAEQPSRVEALVDALRTMHGATLREIEQACAVTPSYLSHVVRGRRIASETLVRLIEAFAVCPSEFERYRTGVATHPHPFDALLFNKDPAAALVGSPAQGPPDRGTIPQRPRGTYARGHPSAESAQAGGAVLARKKP